MKIILMAMAMLNFTVSVQASELKTIKLKLGEKVTTAKSVRDLEDMKANFEAKKFDLCLKSARKAEMKSSEVIAWVIMQRLQCARAFYEKNNKNYLDLADTIETIWSNTAWLIYGPQARALRIELVDASLLILENEIKFRRKLAWVNISKLLEVRDWLDSKQKAKLYRLAGDLSYVQQNNSAAIEYLTRSLKEEFHKGAFARLDSLSRDLNKNEILPLPEFSETISASPDELEIYNRMRSSLKSKDLLAVVSDGVLLLKQFSGGHRANEAAKHIINIYLSLAANTGEKYQSIKDNVLSEMKKVDGQRLYDWAQTMANREYFSDALYISNSSFELLGGQPISTKVLMLAAQSAHHTGDLKKAKEFYEKLIREHAGSRIANEAHYRLGLIEVRLGQYAEASSRFDRFLQLEGSVEFESSTLYWYWRCQQKLESSKANEIAERLIKKYPLNYFGLRARAELNGNKLKFDKELKNTPTWALSLTKNELNAWERFLILDKAGWIEEAQIELSFLSEPNSPESKLVYAYILSEAGDYYRASEVLSRTFTADPQLVTAQTIRIAYPEPYLEDVQKETNRYKIPTQLVYALMKQESSFRTNVKSPAGAMGLMQLMPATAREVASDMRIKISDLSVDLATPATNIRIGTQYLNRRLRAFEGHVPLALGAYNAGIGNIRNWQSSRTDLVDMQKAAKADVFDELWFDELPWVETTGYIKSILRNYLVYKILDQSEIELTNPTWQF